MTEAELPVHLPDGTLIGHAQVRPRDGHLLLTADPAHIPAITDSTSARLAELEIARLQQRVAELEAQLDRVERVRDRFAAKYGALQVAAQAFQIEAADSLDTIGRLDYEPDLGRRGTVECTDG